MKKMLLSVIVTLIVSSLIFGNTAIAGQEKTFQRIATFPITLNNPGAEENVSEIAAATPDGNTLVYTIAKTS
jgi:uncharacterized membrane protein